MIKVTITTTNHDEYNSDLEEYVALDEPNVEITTTEIEESKFEKYLSHIYSPLDVDVVMWNSLKDLSACREWIEDDDECNDIEEIFPTMKKDTLFIATRFGGGQVSELAKGKFTYNHSYLDGGIEEPHDLDETLIQWERI